MREVDAIEVNYVKAVNPKNAFAKLVLVKTGIGKFVAV